jgi:hypothetical protein
MKKIFNLTLIPPPRGHVGGGGGLVASRCIFVLITTLMGHINTATTKKTPFKKSHVTSVGGAYLLCVAPTEVKCEITQSSFLVVAVFLWSNRVVIRKNMRQEATRPPPPPHTWSLGGGVKVKTNIFVIPNKIIKKYFI